MAGFPTRALFPMNRFQMQAGSGARSGPRTLCCPPPPPLHRAFPLWPVRLADAPHLSKFKAACRPTRAGVGAAQATCVATSAAAPLAPGQTQSLISMRGRRPYSSVTRCLALA